MGEVILPPVTQDVVGLLGLVVALQSESVVGLRERLGRGSDIVGDPGITSSTIAPSAPSGDERSSVRNFETLRWKLEDEDRVLGLDGVELLPQELPVVLKEDEHCEHERSRRAQRRDQRRVLWRWGTPPSGSSDVIVVDDLRVRLEHELDGASGTFWPAMPRICGFKMRSAMRVWLGRTGEAKKSLPQLS